MQPVRYLAVSSALALSAVLGSTGCGGSSDDADTGVAQSNAQRMHALGGGLGPQLGLPIIDKQPANASVGVGAGVSFSVVAHAPPGNIVSGYLWRHKNAVVQTGQATSWAIPNVALADAGDVSVEVQSLNGNVLSTNATLTVVSGDWAQLSGRVVSSDTVSQQPALSQCNGAKLAWIKTSAAGIGELRVSQFNGVLWLPLGNALNVNASESATEPSIDCSDFSGTPRPVVAWSEGIGNARTIRIKAFDGTGWATVGSAVTAGGVNARKPVLRLAPFNGGSASTRHVHAWSAIAWIEGGFSKAKFWNGVDWQTYTLGFPSGSRLSDLAMTLDSEHTAGAARDFVPLVAWIGAASGGRTPVGAQVNVGGWRQLGLSPSAGTPGATHCGSPVSASAETAAAALWPRAR